MISTKERNLIQHAKVEFNTFFKQEKQKGEPREQIRIIDIDWSDKSIELCLQEMLFARTIERTDDPNICIPTQQHFDSL